MTNTCIILAGPTAVGKTALAIELAQQLGAEIISCDSRQCFRELSIGVAKPLPSELAAVPHHFINTHSIQETVNAAVFERYALEKVTQLFQHAPFVVMAGGTGMYIRSFCRGLDQIPPVDSSIRDAITQAYASAGMEWLQEAVAVADPIFAAKGEMQNPQRMMRALEVIRGTGKSITDWQSGNLRERPFNIILIGLDLPRGVLYQRINQRVDAMLAAGLEAEVRSLQSFQHLNALQTVGYREWWPYFEGKISCEDVVNQIKTNTRHYAKRQLTWFRKEWDIQWATPEFNNVWSLVQSKLLRQ